MKLNIEGQKLRFRISKEELISLCEGTNIKSQTCLPNEELRISLEVNEGAATPLNLTNIGKSLVLQVSKNSVSSLLYSLPNREGIEVSQKLDDGEALTIILEVDIRSQKRSQKL